MNTKKWTLPKVLTLMITVGLLLLLMGTVVYGIVENGYDYGKYTEEQLPTDLFDFFEALSRKSEYRKEMMRLQSAAFWVAVAVCIPSAVLLLIASKKREHVGTMLVGNVMASASMMTFLLTLYFYSFGRSPRVFIVVLFFLSALLFALLLAVTSRHLGIYTLVVFLCALALGFLVAIFLSQILGLAAVILKELFWIALFIIVTLGVGGSSGTTVYIIVL